MISCNYGKENSLEMSGFLASVAVEGIDGDIFYQLKIYRKSGYFGTNFDFDARLRYYRLLECIAIKGRLVNLDLNFIFFLDD
jgi:hypothetical protein